MRTSEQGRTLRPQPRAVALADLAQQFECEVVAGDLNGVTISGVTLDSKDVRPGDLYLAVPGARRHGAEFGAEAIERGAAAILTDRAGSQQLAQAPAVVLETTEELRPMIGEVAASVYGTHGIHAPIFGVTGTNGKTSIVYLLVTLLEQLGLAVGMSTTAERRVGDLTLVSSLTSPEAPELHALLALMQEQQTEAVALEVSAHAIERNRIDGVMFDVVAFNNLSQDHLDDFGDLNTYLDAKLALFHPTHAKRGVVVVDSPEGRRVARESRIPATTLSVEYGVEADWHLAVTAQDLDGVSFALQGPEGAWFRGRVPVLGRFMAENAAVALIMLHEAGFDLERIAAALRRGVIPVEIPGRLELVSKPGRGPRFYVDYGHTPGSFQAMLDALDEVHDGRVIFMFGADGDRDPSKREEMGRIAAAGSDALVICDYHPRTEDPAAIRAQLIAGARSARRAQVYEEADPRAAIRLAISLAQPSDVILYAGPGHEEHHEVNGVQIPYSAREEVRGALREAGLL